MSFNQKGSGLIDLKHDTFPVRVAVIYSDSIGFDKVY